MSCSDVVEAVVCKKSDIQENQLKTFKLADGEVLLIKQNNVIRALGTKCTHYDTPLLVSGVLGNGRLRCQYHGSCFNITTGDIEDFPGLDSLPCYEVTVDGEDVKVKAKKSELAANRRVKSMGNRCQAAKDSVVCIGGGPASAVCVETLRENNFAGAITMICKETVLPYDRTKCSKEMNMDIRKEQFRNDDFYQKHDITVFKGVEATAVDIKKQTVSLSDNTEIPYTKLLIAVGFDPEKPGMVGENLRNVYVINHFDHGNEISCQLTKQTKVVIIGDCFVALESAEFCSDKAGKVTVIPMGTDKCLGGVFGDRIANAIFDHFKKVCVEFITDAKPTKINGSEAAENVELSNGQKIPADIVIIDVGWVANTKFLKPSGIQVEADGSIETNEYLECNVPNVYIGGDIAKAPIWADDNVKNCCGHIAIAMHYGKVAALNMLGIKTAIKTLPYFWTRLGRCFLRFCGQGQFDDIIYHGNVEEMKYVAFYLKGDKVISTSSCEMDPYVAKYAELRMEGKNLTKADVTGCDPLAWAK